MFIKSLKIRDFRCYESAEFSFGSANWILGANGTGKSTIGDAIVFALCGVTAWGTNRTADLVRIGAESAEVEVVVAVGGGEHTVKRVKTSSGSELWLDGERVSQRAVTSRVLGVSPGLFLLAFSPLFYDTLSPGELRDLLASVLEDPAAEEVMAALPPDIRTVLEQELYALRDPSCPGTRTKVKNDITVCERQLSRLDGSAASLKGRLEQLEQEVRGLPAGDLEEQQSRLAGLERRRAALEAKLKEAVSAAPGEVDISFIKARLEALRAEYRELDKKPVPPVGSACPACGQAVTPEAVQKLKEAAAARKNEVAVEGRRLSAELKRLEEENARASEARKRAAAAAAEIQDELRRVQEEISAVLVASAKRSALLEERARTAAELERQESELLAVSERLQHLKELHGALSAYAEKKNELLSARVAVLLEGGVGLKLQEALKSTGELVPVFKLYYSGRPQQFLSFSEKIRVGLELGRAVRKLTGVNLPCFVDNTESIVGLPDLGVQVFYAQVAAGIRPVEVRVVPDNRSAVRDAWLADRLAG